MTEADPSHRSTHGIRDRFFRKFATFTQHTYLLAYAAAELKQLDMQTVADDLQRGLETLVEEDDRRWNKALQGDSDKMMRAVDSLPSFVVELSLVGLDIRLHELLDDLARMIDPTVERPQPFEHDLKPLRLRDEAVYAGVILLAEVRNALVHGGGLLDSGRYQRLTDAGVSDEVIADFSERLRKELSLSDFLRFKGAVRAVANMALEQHGG